MINVKECMVREIYFISNGGARKRFWITGTLGRLSVFAGTVNSNFEL
jgi:hypothetical protein